MCARGGAAAGGAFGQAIRYAPGPVRITLRGGSGAGRRGGYWQGWLLAGGLKVAAVLIAVDAGIVDAGRADEGGGGNTDGSTDGCTDETVIIAGDGSAQQGATNGTGSGVLVRGLATGKGKGQEGQGQEKFFHDVLRMMMRHVYGNAAECFLFHRTQVLA